MSYEGYWQKWCVNGHSWTAPEHYGEGFRHDDLHCPICGEKRVAYNSVDDTNCDQWGHLHGFDDSLPTIQDFRDAEHTGLWWHHALPEDPQFAEEVGNMPPEDQPRMWEWAVSG